ncbi:MAG: hypothetical protein M1274_06925 [Actinobacteria bacterium]|nr:hypothetical protein [Actinomycetota bacterium]
MAAMLPCSLERRMMRIDTPSPETRQRGRIDTRGAFALLIVGVIGNIVVTWMITGGPSAPRVPVALTQIFTACTWTGAVWLGALLAYEGIVSSRR